MVQPLDASGLTAGWYDSRAYECLKKGDYDKAIADYTEAIRLNPKMPRRMTAGAVPT